MTKTKDFKITRGDTVKFGIELRNTEITPDEIWFSVKKKIEDETYIFQKSLEDGISVVNEDCYEVRVAPEDTQELDLGTYYYDLEFAYGNDIYTPLKGLFILSYDVTRRPFEGG